MAVKEKILDALEKYTYKLRGVVVSKSDVIDNVISTTTNAPLSANQGKLLQDQIDAMNSTLTTSDTTTIPAFAGSAYSNYGGCFYFKRGSQVTVHLGLEGLTANTMYKSKDYSTPFYLPSSYRPLYEVTSHGHGGGAQYDAVIIVEPSGNISIRSTYSYALVDITYDVLAQPSS